MNTASKSLITQIESIAGPCYIEVLRSSTGHIVVRLINPVGYELNNFWRIWATRQIYKVVGRRSVDGVYPLAPDRLHVLPGRITVVDLEARLEEALRVVIPVTEPLRGPHQIPEGTTYADWTIRDEFAMPPSMLDEVLRTVRNELASVGEITVEPAQAGRPATVSLVLPHDHKYGPQTTAGFVQVLRWRFAMAAW